MECPMCYILYDEKKHIPRNLPCGHTFCELCLQQILQPKGFIECPSCRKKLSPDVRPESLSKNFIALDLALKQHQLQSKLQLCDTHQEFQLFFCEDCQEHLCTQCIINHSGHKFVKQEHSVSLLKERLQKAKDQLNDIMDTVNSAIQNATEIKTYQEKYLKEQLQLIDSEFDSLIEKINQKRESFKKEYSHIYMEYIQSLELDIVLHQSVSDQFIANSNTIQETEKLLEQTKVIKNDQLVNKISEIEDQIKKQIKESTISQEKQEFEIPSIVFGSDIYKSISSIAYLDVYQPKICFVGNKNKLIILDLKKFEWKKYNLEGVKFLGYSSAVTLRNDNLLLMGGGNSDQVYEISIQNDLQVIKRQQMPIARKEHCSVVLNDGSVMIMGGYNMEAQKMLNSCYLYIPKIDQWSELAPMKIPKCAFAASLCSYGKYVYTFGGYDSQKRLNDIEKYTISTNTWEIINFKLPKHLSNCAAIHHPRYASKDCIYILGGGHDEGFLKEVYKFTTSPEHKIEVIAEMENGKDLRNKVVLSKHHLYTIGGNGYKCERLNLISKVWDTLPSYYPNVVDNLDSWACALTYTNQSADDMLSSSIMLDDPNIKSIKSNQSQSYQQQNEYNFYRNRAQFLQYQNVNEQINPYVLQNNVSFANNIGYDQDDHHEQREDNILNYSFNQNHSQFREELQSSSNFYNYRYNFMMD
ncbi:kelch motif protein (macronuclear) [Tetrahymena thermophila SB210]|uniref:Kelch motif protein n=1 Tax=Tetrahymena thermophila (strain SB210) TaxID=312017 RepID=Q234A7_TETTS|nr:kelch motif protein [Tetrahymena thermophila SB210]EAR92095.1 kelch motif protein [Tetrahymena thermophila SB210]|eukprot:XP_001012341.1 kelch motif protein [Tetrahymena thermophila SB210]